MATHRRPGRETTPSASPRTRPRCPGGTACEARGRHLWPAAKPRETTHLWPAAKHEGDIPGQDDTPMGSSEPSQRWLATNGGNRCLALPHHHNHACDAEGNDPGQALHRYVCEAEGDNTFLARHLHYTPAKPRETTLLWPGTTPSRLRSRGTTLARHHTATAHGSASQIQNIVHENISQIKKFFEQHQVLSFVKNFRRGGR